MFARKVQSVIWMDRKYQAMGKDGRRQFEALYIFCDGFVSINEAVSAAAKAGCNSSSFLYICFCGMWYPITLDSYYSRAVLTKEKVYYVKEAFGPLYIVRTPDFVPSRAVIPDTPAADIKTWQDGICNDLKLIDKDVSVFTAAGIRIPESRILWNNALISFGLNFFSREIRITTDRYVEHVFSNYYSDWSLSYEYERISSLRAEGYIYYNPFLKTASRSEAEKKKKEKALLKGLDAPPVAEREELFPGGKLMREREKQPHRIYGSTDRDFWRR